MIPRFHLVAGLSLPLLLALAGCQKPAPDYSKPLPPGAPALRLIVDPEHLPDLKPAFQGRDAGLLTSLDRSLEWFTKASTRQFFPLQGITHRQAHASVLALREIAASSASPADFERRILEEMDVYMSVGWNDQGVVLFTGYYTPILQGARTRSEEFRFPLYRRPANLVDQPGKEIKGRRLGDRVVDYPTRASIEAYPDILGLAGQEVVWLRDRWDQYLVHVQGSAKIELTDGGVMYVGFAGTNGYPYVSINRLLVKEGKLDPNRANLPTIEEYFAQHPEDLDRCIRRNDRFIFFKEYTQAEVAQWPAGSLGFQVTPWRSLATDKEIFPRACPVLIVTVAAKAVGGQWQDQRIEQFLADQDTGGAIRAPGRSDIYYGIGPQAKEIAGRQYAEGCLYYFIVKPTKLAAWSAKLPAPVSGPGSGPGPTGVPTPQPLPLPGQPTR